jgi:hypothetical protein
MSMKRIPSLLLGLALPLVAGLGPAHAGDTEVTMYKDPNCGCCAKWAEHMREAGFQVKEVPSTDMARIKQQLGVPERLASCHTARVGRYLVEGHVPAADVKRLLETQPAVSGLAVPGMPQGSPGMEGPYPPDHYEVISFDPRGREGVFSMY